MTFFEERGMNKVHRVLDVTDETGCDKRFPVMACLNVDTSEILLKGF